MKRLLILMLLLAACQPQINSVNSHVGTDGLTIQFVENSPPPIVLENYPFPVRMMVANVGASNVDYRDMLFTFSADPLYLDDGLVYLKPDYGSEEKTRTLHGKSITYFQGESQIFNIPSEEMFVAKKVLGLREKPETQLVANVCYAYSTLLTTTVCIDVNVYEDNLRKQVCSQQDLSFSGGQGAPVAVTEVEVQSFPIVDPVFYLERVRPSFTLHIENVGGGRIIGPDSLELDNSCFLRGIPRDLNGAVEVQATLLNAELECTPNPVKLFAGAGETRCIVPVNELAADTYAVKQNFQSVLVVNLSYLYSNSISTDIMIEREALPVGGLISREEPGYVYEGGMPKLDSEGNPLTKCAQYAADTSSAPDRNTVHPGWSCSCSRSVCLVRARKGECEPKAGLCPAATFCCGDIPEETEEDSE